MMAKGPAEWREDDIGRFIKNDAYALLFEVDLKNTDGTAYDGSGDDWELLIEDLNGLQSAVTIADTNWTISYTAPTTSLVIPRSDVATATTIVLDNGRGRLKNTTLPRVVAQGPWLVDQ